MITHTNEQMAIIAKATPWQLAELIIYLAQSLEPYTKPDPFDNSERLSTNPLFADLAKEPPSITLGSIRSLTQHLDRIYDPE